MVSEHVQRVPVQVREHYYVSRWVSLYVNIGPSLEDEQKMCASTYWAKGGQKEDGVVWVLLFVATIPLQGFPAPLEATLVPG